MNKSILTTTGISFILLVSLIFNIACNRSERKYRILHALKISKSENLFVPDDLQVTLWAESPLLNNPTNMDVDARGRLWVTEAVNYREYNNKVPAFLHRKKGDRIMILEDRDGDGKADTSKVFVQDSLLVSPVGIAVIGSKVIVSCSPNLIIYTDENGDDIPDKREIFLTGFGGKDHDHSLHAVYAGPDGNWYFNVGNAGPHVVKDKSGWTLRAGSVYTGGSPYNLKNEGNEVSDDGKVYVGGLALRIRPDGTHLQVYAHNFRNSYEVIPDSYGNLWQNDNDDQVVACRATWIMEGGNAGYFSADGTRTWQADQRPGQNIFTAHWHQDDPGVMPAGDNSGAGAPTGITVIEGDELGPAYRGMLLSADAGRNIIFGYHPEVKRSGYDLGQRENFISSLADDNARYVWDDSTLKQQKEKWFRPSDVTIGTDGSLYVADWYDPVVGGHLMQDSMAYGRIYRITKKGKQMRPPKIALNTSAGQLLALKSPAINVRNAGFLKLKEQGQRSIALVIGLLDDPNPYIRARVIWLLSQLGPTGVSEVEKLLEDDDQLIRATAYRALRQVVPDILPYAKKVIDDESPFVRREVAASLRMLPYDAKSKDLLDLIKSFDGEDRWYLETIGAACENEEATIYSEIKKALGGNRPSEWNKKMTMMAWRLHPAAAAKDLALRANDPDLDSADRQIALTGLAFVKDKAAAELMSELAGSSLKDVAETARFWLSFRQNNDWASYLDWNKIKLNTAYERRLAEMKVRLATALDEQQSDYERKQQITQMAKDSIGGQMLIGLVSEKKLPAPLIAFVETKIFDNPDATVRAQADVYFKNHQEKKLVASQIMQLKPDAVRGEKIFSMRCSVCHQVAGKGNRIGPDLTSIALKFDDQQLLDAIINPSTSIVFGYDAWLVNTRDHESVFGLMIAENKGSVTIKDISGNNHVISRKNIVSAKKRDQSLMPSAAQNGMNEQHLADVVGYLKKTAK